MLLLELSCPVCDCCDCSTAGGSWSVSKLFSAC